MATVVNPRPLGVDADGARWSFRLPRDVDGRFTDVTLQRSAGCTTDTFLVRFHIGSQVDVYHQWRNTYGNVTGATPPVDAATRARCIEFAEAIVEVGEFA